MCRKRGHGFILYLSPLKLRFCGLWVGFGWICFEFWVDFQLIFSQIQIMILSVFCQFFRIFPEFRLYFQYLTSWIFITCQFQRKCWKNIRRFFAIFKIFWYFYRKNVLIDQLHNQCLSRRIYPNCVWQLFGQCDGGRPPHQPWTLGHSGTRRLRQTEATFLSPDSKNTLTFQFYCRWFLNCVDAISITYFILRTFVKIFGKIWLLFGLILNFLPCFCAVDSLVKKVWNQVKK